MDIADFLGIGFSIAVVAGGNLWSLHTFDAVVAFWPLKTKSRDDDPEGFDRHVFFWQLLAVIGLTLFGMGIAARL